VYPYDREKYVDLLGSSMNRQESESEAISNEFIPAIVYRYADPIILFRFGCLFFLTLKAAIIKQVLDKF